MLNNKGLSVPINLHLGHSFFRFRANRHRSPLKIGSRAKGNNCDAQFVLMLENTGLPLTLCFPMGFFLTQWRWLLVATLDSILELLQIFVFWGKQMLFDVYLFCSINSELFLIFFWFVGLIQPIPRNQFFQSYFNNNFVNEADRPYKCFYCHRAYKKSCHLKQHIR